MKISTYFKLGVSQYGLDFVDIDVSKDKRLFVDPVLLERSEDPWAMDVVDTIGSFFDSLLNLLKANDLVKAYRLFSNLREPNETCLGMSQGRPRGRGVGKEDTKKIFRNLISSKAVKSGLVSDIEDCVIFVDNFGPDKLSDMTTNIIRGHLIEYTKDQCRSWGIPLQSGVATGKIWNKKALRWEDRYDEALIVNGKRILLVPKSIVSLRGIMSAQRFHQMDVLEFLKDEQLSIRGPLVQYRSEKGKTPSAPFVTKKDVEKELAPFSKEFLADFCLKHQDVFPEYKEKARNSAKPLANEDIGVNQSILTICTELTKKFKEVKSGKEHAGDYHRLITGVLEFVFYPNLVRPKVETRIHNGRKRIDITFNNDADAGFFRRAPVTFNISAQIIFIECKNYSGDPENPELDQLAGRFSPQRGKLGLLLCRTFKDRQLLFQRCADHWSDQHGVIIPVCDDDLIEVLKQIANGEEGAIDQLLSDRASEVTLLS